ncbi:MAG: pilus assembly protein TadG-related protein [Erythrobacter sp.]|nr:pilus assembly protein TadG-related protein [Erythrobacter sp.]MDZ4273491.1 pilus assembly protein TadG-related protein [Erythrobacter sp.]
MGRETQVRKTFLRSLLHDRTANTIAISAAALIPVLAMVGGGIDASRYFMTAARMQAACDAGALAARRAMVDDTFTAEHRQVGLNFFDQNFNDGMFGIESRVRDFTSDGEGTVTGTATGRLPTSIMAAFGFNEFNLTVTCSAEINISNTDIVFVLDVTGSMASCPDGSNCGSGPGSKIVALREAVMSFYDTVEEATSASAQVRYGFVPYAQQVNVGFSIPRQFMANRHTYQSRVARFREEFTFIPGNGVEEGDEMVLSDQVEWLPRDISNFDTTDNNNYRFRNSGTAERTAAENFCWNILPGTYTINGDTWVVSNTQYVTGVWSGGPSNNRAGCRGRVRKTRIATLADVINDQTIRNVVWQDYVYCPVDTDDDTPCDVTNPADSPPGWETVDLSTLYDDNRIMTPTGLRGAMVNQVWDGCIEEAATVQTGSYDPLPGGAFDVNINLVPTTEEQKWKPALRNIVWKREDPGTTNWLNNLIQTNSATSADEVRPGYACPTAALKLAEVTRANLNTYVNSLTANGQTYHDIGMIWGGRFISPRGIFASENESAPNGDSISRHIVFMTDGTQVNSNENYSTHGVEWWDRRITGDGNGTREFDRRAARLQAACRAARQENITVWVVAFGTTLTQNLIDCASPGRAFQANDSATLTAQFREIAQKIAALRLTS